MAYQAEFENERRWLTWDLLCGRVNQQHPMWGFLQFAGASRTQLEWFCDNACPPDIIGINYAELRKPDPRIAQIIEGALGPARTVLNVGAGTGSYEPIDRSVVAVEPSRAMIDKRGPAAARAVQASCKNQMTRRCFRRSDETSASAHPSPRPAVA